MTAILNFFAKIAKHKNAYILKTMLDRAFSTKSLTFRLSLQSTHPNFFKNFFVSPKMAAILNFFSKKLQNKNTYISKTVLDRTISTKFLTHRVCLQSNHPNFQEIFVSPKMAAIFRIFCTNSKHRTAYISKTVKHREILTNFLTHRVYLQGSHPNFQKYFVSPKLAAILNF